MPSAKAQMYLIEENHKGD